MDKRLIFSWFLKNVICETDLNNCPYSLVVFHLNISDIMLEYKAVA